MGEINFLYANLFLIPENYPLNNIGELGKGNVNWGKAHIDFPVDNTLVEMHGVTLPLQKDSYRTAEEILDSAKKIFGDFGDNLERCVALAKDRAINEHLHFDKSGLTDPSWTEKLERKTVTQWIYEASQHPSCLKECLPNDIEFEDREFEFVPTYKALRNLSAYTSGAKDSRFITGNTFAERVSHFLQMYDAVLAHKAYESKTRLLWSREIREGNREEYPGAVPVAKLVFPN